MRITKKLKKSTLIVFAMLASVMLTGCVEENPGSSNGGNKENPKDFDFSTSKSVTFNLQYNVPKGYLVHFEMYSKSPLTVDAFKSYVKDSTLTPFLSGRSDENGKISFQGTLPASVSEIYSYSTAIGVPVLMRATVSINGDVSGFEPIDVESAVRSRAATGDGVSGTSSWKTYTVSIAKPTLPAVSTTIPEGDKNLIDKSFPENQNYDIAKSYYRQSIKLKEKASVNIYSVKHGATSDRTNALAYFVYNRDNITPEDINSELQLAFPELNKNVPAEGTGYKLMNKGSEIFEAGTQIGFALFPDIDPKNINTKNTHLLYSGFGSGGWNTYSYPAKGSEQGLIRANVPHMVISLLRVDENGHAIIAISFEDQPFSFTHGTNKGNFRDDIFIVEVTPASALTDDLPTPPGEEPEYDMEFASSGILCFEDCWPHEGDYDINDVVVSYERALLYSNKNGLVGTKEKYTFLNNGATFINGFGYQYLGATQSNITKCTVESEYTCEGQGLDATSANNEAIVMLFDNGKNIKKGTVFNVKTNVALGTNIYGYNPFIVVEKSNGSNNILAKNRLEVHLPSIEKSTIMTRFLPTSKADFSFFGKYSDKSNVTKNIYYVRAGNYPFALDLNWDISKNGDATNFVIPTETKSIDTSYPEFNKWVDSKGTTNTDWYLRPNVK